jgi:hypothetical protein
MANALAWVTVGGGASGPWSFVTGNVSATAAVTKSVTSGNLLVVGYATGGSGSANPIISDGVNSWTQVATCPMHDSTNGSTMSIWWAVAATSASITAIISSGGGSFDCTWIAEYSYPGATFGADGGNNVANAAGSGTADALHTGSVTTNLDGDLIVSFILDAINTPSTLQFTAGTSPNVFTGRPSVSQDPGGGSAITCHVEDFVQTTAGSINPSWSEDTGNPQNYDGITACFKKA